MPNRRHSSRRLASSHPANATNSARKDMAKTSRHGISSTPFAPDATIQGVHHVSVQPSTMCGVYTPPLFTPALVERFRHGSRRSCMHFLSALTRGHDVPPPGNRSTRSAADQGIREVDHSRHYHAAGGRRGKERAARHERSSDWRRGAAGSPDPKKDEQQKSPSGAAGSPDPDW